jgi:hypothetical protein
MGININNQLDNIIFLNNTYADIDDLLGQTGLLDKFEKKLSKELIFLSVNGIIVIDQKPKTFENLKGCQFFCLRIKMKKNIRLLFIKATSNSKEVFIFIHAFEEKSSKDYNKAIKVANQRVEYIKKQ